MAHNSVPPAASNASSAFSTGETRILYVDPSKIGRISWHGSTKSLLKPDYLGPQDDWVLELNEDTPDAAYLKEAATHLRTTDIPVAFPTETVYGLGADATRSAAVRGIYKAKQRPSDNPLIVHICSLTQLRNLLRPPQPQAPVEPNGQDSSTSSAATTLIDVDDDPIPSIYHPLIRRFWPGPLTILLPLPHPSPLAPEVTSTLPTFGARMPSSLLALALLHTATTPLAAPSANASTKPSPTTAQHVFHDLNGRIDIILDGGPCSVGVESTVVDGLCNPPCVLRPGGISIDQLRSCPGWENVVIGYKDAPQLGDKAPRAPGMKYKHYSPRAGVILFEGCSSAPDASAVNGGREKVEEGGDRLLTPAFIRRYTGDKTHIGIITTKHWTPPFLPGSEVTKHASSAPKHPLSSVTPEGPPSQKAHEITTQHLVPSSSSFSSSASSSDVAQKEPTLNIRTIALGTSTVEIARGLFSALRALDELMVDVILVEGIEEHVVLGGEGEAKDGDVAAAVMNRLRKAAGEVVRLDHHES